MTLHTVFFKEHEGIAQNSISGALSAVPRWNSGLGSQPQQPPAAAAAYGRCEAFVQSKLASLQLSTGGNPFNAAKESEDQHGQLGKGNTTHHFTLFSGDCKTSENEEKTPLQSVSSVQAATNTMDIYGAHLELGFGQPLQIYGKYPYSAEQCYGVYSTYGTHIAGRIMLPLSMSTDGGPIFVNAKQYHGIMRRRKKRAEAELENKVIKLRKPYLHLSRHLHAMRRPRGTGGRFLNTKSTNGSNEKTDLKKAAAEEKWLLQPSGSQISEVLQSDDHGGINSSGSRSNSPGSEVSSDHHVFSRDSITFHPFQINHHDHLHHTSFQHFPDAANTGLGIAMVSGNFLKV